MGLDSDLQAKTPDNQQFVEFFKKGSEIEVNINDFAFNAAWYLATILENPSKSPSKKRKGTLVQYKTLLAEDGICPLIEHVDPSHIRPLPPGPTDDDVANPRVFKENDIVDANFRDGLWTGTVREVLEGSRYRVSFEDPPDVIDFDGADLRLHFDWVFGKWVRPEKLELGPEIRSVLVEDSPSQPVDEENLGVMKKQKKQKLNSLEEDNNMELSQQKNEGSSGRKGRGRPPKVVERSPKPSETGTENHVAGSVAYESVGDENTDNKRVEGSGGRAGRKRPSKTIARSPKTPENGVENLDAGNIVSESVGKDITVPQDACGGGIIETSGSAFVQKDEGDVSLALVPKAMSEDDLPLSKWFGGILPGKPSNKSNGLKRSISQMNSIANAEKAEDASEGNTVPFIKKSPFWNVIESMEVFQIMPQKPHFGPLIECKEDYREGAAIGIMVTFSEIFNRISSLHVDDSKSTFESVLDDLHYFDKHGFDVSIARARVIELLNIKDGQEELLNESEETNRQIRDYSDEKGKLEVVLHDIEMKMNQLQEDFVMFKSKRESVEQNLDRLQVHADLTRDRIKNAQGVFEKIVASPFKRNWNLTI